MQTVRNHPVFKQNYGKDGRNLRLFLLQCALIGCMGIGLLLRVCDDVMKKIKKESEELRLLLRSVPSPVVVMFVLAVFSMNLLANKSIALPLRSLALDCGIIVSWFAFLAMDMITKHFGPKAAMHISVFATLLNLIMCMIFFIGSRIPGTWGESGTAADPTAMNVALDRTFGGTWYVLAGSTLAFLVGAAINNLSNYGVGRLFRKNPDGFAAYALRSYVSTAVGQFADNLTFALVVSHFFFGWSLTQCVTCALTGMLAELLCEVLFSGVGYRVCRKWKQERIGEEYFCYLKENGAHRV